jgi:hypothetical protein
MTFEQFQASLAGDQPPEGIGAPARSLWLDGKGKWAEAHELASEIPGRDGASIHAYLHRKEGDQDNARYWYRQAARNPATGSLDAEWQALVREYL